MARSINRPGCVSGQSISEEPSRSTFDSTTSKGANKRGFGNRASTAINANYPFQATGSNNLADTDYDDTPPGKRLRGSDWPLSSVVYDPPVATRPDSSPLPRRPSSVQKRRSKFVEGSMNDRASQRPPNGYIDGVVSEDGQANLLGGLTCHPDLSLTDSSFADKSDISRQSGLFRFGKSIAASFNPNNWKIWSKPQRQHREETRQEQAISERREKAEKLYQELKLSAEFPNYSSRRSSSQQPRGRIVDSKHDSGVNFDSKPNPGRAGLETCVEEKRHGRIFLEPSQIQFAPESPGSPVSASGDVARDSPSKSSVFISKRASQPNRKRQDSDPGSISSSHGDHQARRIPSRKDLQKQQRLVKRVSDLEAKLDAARRQLSETLHEPLPQQPMNAGKARFIPGALVSLPSERLLTGYVEPNEDLDRVLSGIDTALTSDQLRSGPSARPSTLEEHRAKFSPNVEEAFRSTRQSRTASPLDMSLPASLGGKDLQSLAPDLSHLPLQSNENANIPATNIERKLTNTPTQKLSKKRKSTFAEDDKFKPSSESGSDAYSDLMKFPPRKGSTSRSHNLHKKSRDQIDDDQNVQTSLTPDVGAAASHEQRARPGKRGSREAVYAPSGKASKSKIPRKDRQSISLVAESTFGTLEYTKPSARASSETPLPANVIRSDDENNETASGAAMAKEEIPPVPKMPKAIRLPSGEVVSTQPAAPVSKFSTAKLSTKNSHTQASHGADTWPDYVF